MVEGIVGLNFVGYMLLTLLNGSGYNFSSTFTILMLKDPKYYNLDPKVLAEDYGYFVMYSDLISIVMKPLFGIIMDIYGRKKPLIIAFIVMAITNLMVPWFKQLYPSFFIVKTINYVFCNIVFDAPLLPDYV